MGTRKTEAYNLSARQHSFCNFSSTCLEVTCRTLFSSTTVDITSFCWNRTLLRDDGHVYRGTTAQADRKQPRSKPDRSLRSQELTDSLRTYFQTCNNRFFPSFHELNNRTIFHSILSPNNRRPNTTIN